MVRSSDTRIRKYNAKFDGDVVNQRITTFKPFMVEQVGFQYPIQAEYERKIKGYLERIGMHGIKAHHYMNFGQECWALSRTFSQVTLRMEVVSKAEKWIRRNCLAEHLIKIAALFGVDLVGYV